MVVMDPLTGRVLALVGGFSFDQSQFDRATQAMRQPRYGRTIYKHDQRECTACDATRWENQPEPGLIDRREQVLDPMTAYQITSIMEGVV